MAPTALRPHICAALLAATLAALYGCGPEGSSQVNRGETDTRADQTAPGGEHRPTLSTVSGSAFYRERIALPPAAVFEATLEVVEEGTSTVLGRYRLDPAGSTPFAFSIEYDASRITSRHPALLSASVTLDGQTLFASDGLHPLPPEGETVELLLVSTPRDDAAPRAELQNTYWKALVLGGEHVAQSRQPQETHFVLHPADGRVAGAGGCNRFTGAYELAGQTLRFSQLASTMMACAAGMDNELRLHVALNSTASWRIRGEKLELLDAAGGSLASFEAVYLR